jgi:formamidopyrimidine-DNA glycosylase
MPELPEVETVRRGLEPHLVGQRIVDVVLNRADLRFPFPDGFAKTLSGATVTTLDRRGKYLLAHLNTGACWITHLGMSGRLTLSGTATLRPGDFYDGTAAKPQHDHVVVRLGSRAVLTYNDTRRFGFMDLVPSAGLDTCKHFAAMGPEPLSNRFDAVGLHTALRRKFTPIKAALLDQAVVAGLGNIYVCEALWQAHIHPGRESATLTLAECATLVPIIQTVLRRAIDAGGSTLRDYVDASGVAGGYQAHFSVYDRAGAPCLTPGCSGTIARMVQSGRSSFFCAHCQI